MIDEDGLCAQSGRYFHGHASLSWWKISKKLWIKERENVSLFSPGPVEKVRHPNEWRASRLGVARNSQSRTKKQHKKPMNGLFGGSALPFCTLLSFCKFANFPLFEERTQKIEIKSPIDLLRGRLNGLQILSAGNNC